VVGGDDRHRIQTWTSIERRPILERTYVEQPPGPDPRQEQRTETAERYDACVASVQPPRLTAPGTPPDRLETFLYETGVERCASSRDSALERIEQIKPVPPLPIGTSTVIGTDVSVDWASNAVRTGLVTLMAFVLAGATWVWTRPAAAGDIAVASNGTTANADELTTAAEVPIKSAHRPANADVAESLRQLKALHDEGILTDDEYETKRQDLSERL
jgi:hypothetical protein